MTRDAILYASLLTVPLVWFLNLEASFAIAPLSTSPGGRMAVHILSLIALAIAAGASWFSWKKSGQEDVRRDQTRRALSIGAAILNAGFFLVVLAQAIPNFILNGAES